MRISDWSSDVCSSDLLMMLPADMQFIRDPVFRQYTELYAKDEAAFFKDFAAAFEKLLELGTPMAQQRGAGGWFWKLLGYRSAERSAGNERVSTCRSRWSPYN